MQWHALSHTFSYATPSYLSLGGAWVLICTIIICLHDLHVLQLEACEVIGRQAMGFQQHAGLDQALAWLSQHAYTKHIGTHTLRPLVPMRLLDYLCCIRLCTPAIGGAQGQALCVVVVVPSVDPPPSAHAWLVINFILLDTFSGGYYMAIISPCLYVMRRTLMLRVVGGCNVDGHVVVVNACEPHVSCVVCVPAHHLPPQQATGLQAR